MTLRIEQNNDPLIALHGTDHTRTQRHSEVDRPIEIATENSDIEVPLSRHPAMIRPIRTLIVLTDLKTQPGARNRLDQIDKSRLDFLAGFTTRLVLRTQKAPIELGQSTMISRVEHHPAYPQQGHDTGDLGRP